MSATPHVLGPLASRRLGLRWLVLPQVAGDELHWMVRLKMACRVTSVGRETGRGPCDSWVSVPTSSLKREGGGGGNEATE